MNWIGLKYILNIFFFIEVLKQFLTLLNPPPPLILAIVGGHKLQKIKKIAINKY